MLSILDFFTIGIGPSSSHSVGPMRAARQFALGLSDEALHRCHRIQATLFGSLALTGKGHGTDRALLLGLMGERPESVDVDSIAGRIEQIRTEKRLVLSGGHAIDFDEQTDLLFDRKSKCPLHPNRMELAAFDTNGELLQQNEYYSVGGGFVLTAAELQTGKSEGQSAIPYPFGTGEDLLRHAKTTGLSISSLLLANELAIRSEQELRSGVAARWEMMQQCVERGCRREGILPGGLKVVRRAPALYRRLQARRTGDGDPLATLDWVNLFALAVNEENAAGGRVVTAPTNGAAGIIPAVLHYYTRFCKGADDEAVLRFFLTAGAIAMLFKQNASISGAEVGCQGEVGSAASMAAGGLTEVLGGTPQQVLQAAEIAMEHHLGLTCDPIGGLVQIPCIERNAVASVTAINASRLALAGDGVHRVSLDKVIATMRQTGADMSSKYKETARGGLAIHVNVVEC